MTKQEFLNKLEEILDCPKNSLDFESKFEDQENFDSLILMDLVAFADKSFQVRIAARDLKELTTVATLWELIGEAQITNA